MPTLQRRTRCDRREGDVLRLKLVSRQTNPFLLDGTKVIANAASQSEGGPAPNEPISP